jgi:hypothetical protein
MQFEWGVGLSGWLGGSKEYAAGDYKMLVNMRVCVLVLNEGFVDGI